MESGIGAAHDREQKAGFREVLETDGLGAGEPGDVPDRGLEGWIDGGATRPNGGSGEVTDRARRAGQGQVLGNSRKTSFQDSVVSHPAVSLPGPGGGVVRLRAGRATRGAISIQVPVHRPETFAR